MLIQRYLKLLFGDKINNWKTRALIGTVEEVRIRERNSTWKRMVECVGNWKKWKRKGDNDER
jgi:hypothetical protein